MVTVEVLADDGLRSDMPENENKSKESNNDDRNRRRILKGKNVTEESLDNKEESLDNNEKSENIEIIKHEEPKEVDVDVKMISLSQFQPKKNIVFVDILKDFLFIGYAIDGIEIYNIKDTGNIKYVATIDNTYFLYQL